jgi:hypothetical protein
VMPGAAADAVESGIDAPEAAAGVLVGERDQTSRTSRWRWRNRRCGSCTGCRRRR